MAESNSNDGTPKSNATPAASPTRVEPSADMTIANSKPSTSPCAADLPPPKLAVGSRLDTYELVEKLGEGGMGAVWKARHVKLDKFVALKVLPMHVTQNPEAVRRFEREMRAVGKLEHPHVVRAMDAGEIGGLHFLVMEYVEGTDLSKYIQTRGPRSVADACAMLRHAALGLAAAHAQGLIHRDIKPSNLLLSKQGQVKVLDLGLARLLEDGAEPRQITHSGQVLGTPDFMAPEQWDDTHAVDHRADLYALGCTLCFLLIGRAPFGDDRHTTMGQKMKGHLLEPISRLRDLRDDIPAELDDLYARLMEKDPARRLISAEETATLLKTIAQSHSTKPSSNFASKPIANSIPPAMPPTLAAGPSATIPGVSDPGAAATMSWNGKEGTEIVDTGDDVTVHDAGGEATRTHFQLQPQAQPQSQARAATAAPPRRRNPLKLVAAGGAALFLVLLLGVIVIKIVNKDGTTTELRVPDGTSVEVLKDGKLLGKVDIEKGGPTKTPPTPPSPSTPPSVNASTLALAPFDAAAARAHQEAWARRIGAPVEFTNSIGMKFRLIPPGEFLMGMTPQEAATVAGQGDKDENIKNAAVISVPAHRVRMTQPYYLGTYEVTQEQYEKVVGVKPAFFSEDGVGKSYVKAEEMPLLPIEHVSYIDAAKFCIKLSELERRQPAYSSVDDVITVTDGNGYRLPTEAEWEWACRAGSTTAWSCGGQETSLAAVAWITDNADTRTHPVGRLKPNPFGLYDMHGNVWEHCQDWYDAEAYAKRGAGPTEDPRGPDSGAAHMIRGGGWPDYPVGCRSAFRRAIEPTFKNHHIGFRVLATIAKPRAGE